MTTETRPEPADIRQARLDNPKMRERDLAGELGISEAELVAANCGEGATRIEPRVEEFLRGLEAVGEVMALTRNESAVHEKIGLYQNVTAGEHGAMVLGAEIDLRVFPRRWVHGFAVEKREGNDARYSLQFFDATGAAVHKVHLRPASSLYAYQRLVESLATDDRSQTLEVEAPAPAAPATSGTLKVSREALRTRWQAMTDVHDFFGLLRALNLTRRQALRMVGDDYAWQINGNALTIMMDRAAQDELPIMCFVGNDGCIQIHSGPIGNIKPMGPWLNVMDKTFHLHLRADRIAELWAVRKPARGGHVTSLEAYDADGDLIIQFFGKRRDGEDERADWRALAEALPRVPQSFAA